MQPTPDVEGASAEERAAYDLVTEIALLADENVPVEELRQALKEIQQKYKPKETVPTQPASTVEE